MLLIIKVRCQMVHIICDYCETLESSQQKYSYVEYLINLVYLNSLQKSKAAENVFLLLSVINIHTYNCLGNSILLFSHMMST